MNGATKLILRFQPQVPLQAPVISPDNFIGKSASEILKLPVLHGNQPAALGDFFEVKGNGSSEIILEGDLTRVKNIGTAMTQGKINITGNSGMHLGSHMRGGEIYVEGNVGDWAGAEMAGGKILIRGNAGHGLGGAYRGSRYGMKRGLIMVEGNAGNETGAVMRRGLIVVTGNTGDFAGAFMIAGSIVILGKLGARPGAGMLRGTMVAVCEPEILPTFRYACTYEPSFLKLIFREIGRQGVTISEEYQTGRYRRYSGDFNRTGKGEILVYDQR